MINERTTVASAYAMTQFIQGGAIAGPSPGVQNAAGMVGNMVDAATGLRVVTSLLDSVGGRFEVLSGRTDGTTVRAVFPPHQRDANG